MQSPCKVVVATMKKMMKTMNERRIGIVTTLHHFADGGRCLGSYDKIMKNKLCVETYVYVYMIYSRTLHTHTHTHYTLNVLLIKAPLGQFRPALSYTHFSACGGHGK